LPVINTWGEADPVDLYFRLLLLPLLIGFALWLSLAGAPVLWTRLRGQASGFSNNGLAELKKWLGILPRRWPYLALALLILLGGWHQMQAFQDASHNLLNYCASLRLDDRQGYLSARYPITSWVAPAENTHIVESIDFNSDNTTAFKSEYFNMRYLGMFHLEQARYLEIEMSSDDGSLLLIDGIRRINILGEHPIQTVRNKFKLAAGWHTLEILFFQHRHGAYLKLIMPPEVSRAMRPLSARVDPAKLWRLNRQIEVTRNRSDLLIWAGAFMLLLMLMPYPKGWERTLTDWVRGHGPLLAVLGLAAVLLSFRMDIFPGMHKDEALVGDWAFTLHWYGLDKGNISAWAWSNLTVKLILYAQKVLLLDVITVRIFAVIINACGLLLCSMAVERLFNKRLRFLQHF
jgi:hypothetical protein